MIRKRQPITEAGFLQEPLGQQYFDYARYTVASLVRDVELKWHPGRSGISLDDFVLDASIYAIELAKEDYAKGVFRNENADSFRKFFYWRIFKAFFAKLDELGKDPNKAVFDERLAKYYEGTAVDFGPSDDAFLVFYSAEKAMALEESHEAKMAYVSMIRSIVSRMSPNDQRLFYLKYQLDFTDEDFRLWKEIKEQKHVKDPFTKMAHLKYGISEGYARKRICQIKADISAELNKLGLTPGGYRENTSVPTTIQAITDTQRPSPFDLEIDNLTDADCHDILVELNY